MGKTRRTKNGKVTVKQDRKSLVEKLSTINEYVKLGLCSYETYTYHIKLLSHAV